jgi:hypothetical protein
MKGQTNIFQPEDRMHKVRKGFIYVIGYYVLITSNMSFITERK